MSLTYSQQCLLELLYFGSFNQRYNFIRQNILSLLSFFICGIGRNWQTREFQVLVSKDVGVRVPYPAPNRISALTGGYFLLFPIHSSGLRLKALTCTLDECSKKPETTWVVRGVFTIWSRRDSSILEVYEGRIGSIGIDHSRCYLFVYILASETCPIMEGSDRHAYQN